MMLFGAPQRGASLRAPALQQARATADMLAQLLEKHGIHARVADHEAAGRERIGSLETAGLAMICLVYLEIAGNDGHGAPRLIPAAAPANAKRVDCLIGEKLREQWQVP